MLNTERITEVIIFTDLEGDVMVIVPEKLPRQPYSSIDDKYPSYEDILI